MADIPAFRFPSEPAAAGGRDVSRAESLIDRESHFTGAYRTPHNLRIEGRYEGEIDCQGTVFIGETAIVSARINAGNVTIAGQCEGEIVCETRFEILPTGRVAGSVAAATTVVHEGAFYQGEVRMTRGSAPEQGQRGFAPPAAGRAAAPPAGPTAQYGGATPASRRPAPAAERPSPAVQAAPERRRLAEPAAGDAEPEMPSSLVPRAAAGRTGSAANGRAPATGNEEQPNAEHRTRNTEYERHAE